MFLLKLPSFRVNGVIQLVMFNSRFSPLDTIFLLLYLWILFGQRCYCHKCYNNTFGTFKLWNWQILDRWCFFCVVSHTLSAWGHWRGAQRSSLYRKTSMSLMLVAVYVWCRCNNFNVQNQLTKQFRVFPLTCVNSDSLNIIEDYMNSTIILCECCCLCMSLVVLLSSVPCNSFSVSHSLGSCVISILIRMQF